jgi:hypothetical protein
MRPGALFLALIGLAASAAAAPAKPPVVVELFTAQGCGSCGKADAHVGALAEQKGVLALTWSVDYWDYLGWKDTFAKPEFAERQRAYAHKLDVAEVYTPQVVVDGRLQTGAVRTDDVDDLVRDARRDPTSPPYMRVHGGYVGIGKGRAPAGGADVWLVRYDPHEQQVMIKDGDSRGQTVTERNVVVQLERLGGWRGKESYLALPAPPAAGLKTVVLVQGAHGGRIVGVIEPAS